MKERKVGIVGLGNVGAHCALGLAMAGAVNTLRFYDIDFQKAESERLDLLDSTAALPHRVHITAGEAEALADCDIVVVALASKERHYEEDRLAELRFNLPQVRAVIPRIVAAGFRGLFINITNPCDVITQEIYKLSGFPKERVFGTGTALDSYRLRRILSERSGVDVRSIEGFMLGEHGNSQIVAWSQVRIGGVPFAEWKRRAQNPEALGEAALEEAVRTAAWRVWDGKHCTDFAIALALTRIVEAIFDDAHLITPLSTRLEGEYGEREIYAGVPCELGSGGVTRVAECALPSEELARFHQSVEVIRQAISAGEQW
ncbi:MAG: L-lactate dehydrogenase [Clostridia bacterium]|nr:L-lactate dehydrogenase [Clostridia bacterium]